MIDWLKRAIGSQDFAGGGFTGRDKLSHQKMLEMWHQMPRPGEHRICRTGTTKPAAPLFE